MNVLALDLGTFTGWACRFGGRMESGTQDFTKKRGESNGMLFLHFNSWLINIASSFLGKPEFGLVVYEMPHHRGGAATEIAVGLATRVQEFCAVHNIEHSSVHSATLKKFATGNGRASKEDMIAVASGMRTRFATQQCAYHGPPAFPISDDNEADAILLLHYAVQEILGEKAWNVRDARESHPLPTVENTAK